MRDNLASVENTVTTSVPEMVDYGMGGFNKSYTFGNQGRGQMMDRTLSVDGAVTDYPKDQSGLLGEINYLTTKDLNDASGNTYGA
jgi:hypothetical protein